MENVYIIGLFKASEVVERNFRKQREEGLWLIFKKGVGSRCKASEERCI